jgi:hypothetical protein
VHFPLAFGHASSMPRSKVAMAIGGRFIARDACGYVESSEIPKKDDTGSISSLFYVHTNLLFVGLTIYLYIYVYTHICYHILPCTAMYYPYYLCAIAQENFMHAGPGETIINIFFS